MSDAGVDAGPVDVKTLPFPAVPRFDAGEPAFQLKIETTSVSGLMPAGIEVVFTSSYVLSNMERFGTELTSACGVNADPSEDLNTSLNAGMVTVSFSPSGGQYQIPYGTPDAGFYELDEIIIPAGSTLNFSNAGAPDGGTIAASSFTHQLSSPPKINEPMVGAVVQRGQAMRLRWTGNPNRVVSFIGILQETDGGAQMGGPPIAACGVPANLDDVLIDITSWAWPGPYQVLVMELLMTSVSVSGFTQARVVEWSIAASIITVQ